MPRHPSLAAVFGLVIALLGVAGPARASEGHCATPVAEAAPRHQHEHAQGAVTPAAQLRAGDAAECPECPTRGPCAMLHGCGPAVAGVLAPVGVVTLAPPACRAVVPQREAAPPSFVASPPTPPPNLLLSRLA